MLPAVTSAASITGEASAINAPPREPFFLVHTPNVRGSWTVRSEGLPGPTWVPDCSDYPVVGGAAGVRQAHTGMAEADQIQPAVNALQSAGRIPIPRTAGYMKTSPCRNPANGQAGVIHHRAWETFAPAMRKGEADSARIDYAQQNAAFIRYYKEGLIPPPDPRLPAEIIRQAIESASKELAHTDRPDGQQARIVGAACQRARVFVNAARPWDPKYKPDPALLAEIDAIEGVKAVAA